MQRNIDNCLVNEATIDKERCHLLFRDESGKIFDSPAFGAPWFDEYNNFLCRHKNEKLLYVYAGSVEIVITPENEILNPLGLDAERYFEGVENPYERFYNENAVYVP